MSETFDPYCIYCDEGADGDHARCEALWKASENAPASSLLPTPTPPPHGANATISFGDSTNGVRSEPLIFRGQSDDYTVLRTDEVQERLAEKEGE